LQQNAFSKHDFTCPLEKVLFLLNSRLSVWWDALFTTMKWVSKQSRNHQRRKTESVTLFWKTKLQLNSTSWVKWSSRTPNFPDNKFKLGSANLETKSQLPSKTSWTNDSVYKIYCLSLNEWFI
jgi:hypothetical protein